MSPRGRLIRKKYPSIATLINLHTKQNFYFIVIIIIVFPFIIIIIIIIIIIFGLSPRRPWNLGFLVSLRISRLLHLVPWIVHLENT